MAAAVRVRCSEDDAGGGQKAKRYAGIHSHTASTELRRCLFCDAELRGFQQRASNLLRDADHDSNVLVTFSTNVDQALDDLMQARVL